MSLEYRIVLADEGGDAQPSVAAAPAPPAPPPSPASSTPLPGATPQHPVPVVMVPPPGGFPPTPPLPVQPPPAPPGAPAFDPFEEARKRLESEERARAVKAAYEILNPPAPPPEFNPVAEAQRRLEAEQRAAAVKAAYEELNPPTPPPEFDPEAAARGRLEAEQRSRDVQSAYFDLNPKAFADAVATRMGSFLGQTSGLVAGAGAAESQLAGNRNLQGLMTAADTAASALSMLGPPGVAAAGAIELLVAPVREATSAAAAFVERGKQIQQFSGELTSANFTANIRSMLADIREAQELGPDLAKLTEAQSEMETNLRNNLLEIKKALIETLIPIIQGFAEFFRGDAARRLVFPGLEELAEKQLERIRPLMEQGNQLALQTGDELRRLIRAVTRKDEPVGNEIIGKQLELLQNQVRVGNQQTDLLNVLRAFGRGLGLPGGF